MSSTDLVTTAFPQQPSFDLNALAQISAGQPLTITDSRHFEYNDYRNTGTTSNQHSSQREVQRLNTDLIKWHADERDAHEKTRREKRAFENSHLEEAKAHSAAKKTLEQLIGEKAELEQRIAVLEVEKLNLEANLNTAQENERAWYERCKGWYEYALRLQSILSSRGIRF